MGFNMHVDFNECNIYCLISSTDTSLNDKNVGSDLSGRVYGFKSIN